MDPALTNLPPARPQPGGADRLAGLPDVLELPGDRTRPVELTADPVTVDLALPDGARKAMARLADEAGVDLADAWVGALAAFVSRCARTADVVVAVPIDGAWRPVRVDVSDDPSFVEVLRRASKAVAEAAADVDAGRPLPAGPPSTTQVLVGDADAAPVPPGVEWLIAPGDDAITWRFSPETADASTIERLGGHLLHLLEAAADAPATAVSAVPLLTAEARHEILVDWNATAMAYPAQPFHELFRARAATGPERPAVECATAAGAERLTYGELDAASDRLAQHLQGLGARPGVLVGICVERSVDMVVGLLGILKTGAAYVPIDPTYPAERIGWMLEDSAAPIVVTQAPLAALLEPYGRRLVLLDADADELAARAGGPTPVESDPEDTAYVIFTSGSTGRPKGVQVPHRALVNFLVTMAEAPGLTADDTLVAVTTLSFDIAGLELYLPLLQGGRLVVATRDETTDGRRLSALLAASGATAMQATPATWRMLVESGWDGRPRIKVLCGGEALPPGLAVQLLERADEVWNLYGPTETTIWSARERIRPGRPVTIGGPIGNTQIYVLDPTGEPTPIGVAGELCIGGDGVALGYLGRPDLTAERFVPNPHRPGERMYRTGDLARFRPDATVEFLGRLDHQVKVRGFRIELGEIEARLAEHPQVAVCVVVARPDAHGEQQLVAYHQPPADGGAGAAPSARELRDHLAGRVPGYMVPAIFVALAEMPLTPNGKIDRGRLPAPEVGAPADGFVAPRDATERRLVAIWEDVLGIAPIGVETDFFDLGVSSITAARLFAEIERREGAQLPLGAMFQAPTVAALAGLVGSVGGPTASRGATTSLVPIQPDGTRPPIFCVHGGAGTILHLQPLSRALGPDQPFYAFQAQGLYGDRPPHSTVDQMAGHYVSEMRQVQRHGPYLVAGYCFGAVVAQEMAVRLREAGEEVDLVVTLNGPSPRYLREVGPLVRQRLRRGQRFTDPDAPAEAPARPRAAAPRSLPERVYRSLAFRTRRRLAPQVRRGRIAWSQWTGRGLPEHARDRYFLLIAATAEQRHAERPFDGRLLAFWGQDLWEQPTSAWAGLAGEVEDVELPGTHADQRVLMASPSVERVAEILSDRIDRAVASRDVPA
jgi:amino acid adenylation domain-containing protein